MESRFSAGCSTAELGKIASLTSEHHAKAGQVLTERGDPGLEFFIIVEGDATATRKGVHPLPSAPAHSTTTPADQFTYGTAAAPTVTAITPTTGPAAGGTLVTITGTNFTGSPTPTVNFGPTAATNVTVVGATSITADSPAGTNGNVVDVTVKTATGTSATTPADQFTYGTATAPTVTAITPATSPGGRRHFGDDHRHQLHRQPDADGQLRPEGGDECHRCQHHLDHGRQPARHRQRHPRGRDRENRDRHLGHLGRR